MLKKKRKVGRPSNKEIQREKSMRIIGAFSFLFAIGLVGVGICNIMNGSMNLQANVNNIEIYGPKKKNITNKTELAKANFCTTYTLYYKGVDSSEAKWTASPDKLNFTNSSEEGKVIITPKNRDNLIKNEIINITLANKKTIKIQNTANCDVYKKCEELNKIDIYHGSTNLSKSYPSNSAARVRTYTLRKGGSLGVYVDVDPINTKYKASEIKWISSDPSIVSIESNGQTALIKANVATNKKVRITAKLDKETASFDVRVKNNTGLNSATGTDEVKRMVDCSNSEGLQNTKNKVANIVIKETDGKLNSGQMCYNYVSFDVVDNNGYKITNVEYSYDNKTFNKLSNKQNEDGSATVSAFQPSFKGGRGKVYIKATNDKGQNKVFEYVIHISGGCIENGVNGIKVDDTAEFKDSSNNVFTGNCIEKQAVFEIEDKYPIFSVYYSTDGVNFDKKAHATGVNTRKVKVYVTSKYDKIWFRTNNDRNGYTTKGPFKINVQDKCKTFDKNKDIFDDNPTVKLTGLNEIKTGKVNKKGTKFKITSSEKIYKIAIDTVHPNKSGVSSNYKESKSCKISGKVANCSINTKYNKLYYIVSTGKNSKNPDVVVLGPYKIQ